MNAHSQPRELQRSCTSLAKKGLTYPHPQMQLSLCAQGIISASAENLLTLITALADGTPNLHGVEAFQA